MIGVEHFFLYNNEIQNSYKIANLEKIIITDNIIYKYYL